MNDRIWAQRELLMAVARRGERSEDLRAEDLNRWAERRRAKRARDRRWMC